MPDDEKPVVKVSDDPLTIPNTIESRLEDIVGLLIRTTSAPTWKPRSYRESFAIDTTNTKFYWYDFDNKTWAGATGGTINTDITYYDAGNSGTSKTIDWSNGAYQQLTLTGNVTLTFSNPKKRIYLRVIQGSGPYTITWPTIKWENSTSPTLSTGNTDIDLFAFLYNDTDYLGSYAYNFG